MSNGRSLTVPGRYESIRPICEFVVAAAADAGISEDAAFRIELACDEAATNIIEHAYGGEASGDVTVGCTATPDAFTIIMRDNGQPFDPAAVPPPPNVATQITDVTPEELSSQLQVGGLGLHMIRNLMDEVHFSFDETQGNTLIMVKRLGRNDLS